MSVVDPLDWLDSSRGSGLDVFSKNHIPVALWRAMHQNKIHGFKILHTYQNHHKKQKFLLFLNLRVQEKIPILRDTLLSIMSTNPSPTTRKLRQFSGKLNKVYIITRPTRTIR